ncbi:MAG: glutamyl-tRNA reductase [Opitutaceae bacterium]|nr:glutamyl-tRNA reductase [Opitutaceae bacterium]
MDAPVPHPTLFLLGASHQTAPLALREKLSLNQERAAAFTTRLQQLPGVRECALLNTCNRVEVYGVSADLPTLASIRAAFCEITGCTLAELDGACLQLANGEVIAHLFEVASGLDSQIVGETEILGQVKAAYAAAQVRRLTGPVLNRVFQKAFQAAKHVRTHTAIGTGQISIATVAVDLAEKIFGSLEEIKILVVGAGEIGVKTVQSFQSRGARSITVASRTLAKAEVTAAQAGGWAASIADLPETLAAADVVTCSTSAPGAVITAVMTATAMHRRPSLPLFLIDLALPRDIEPAAGKLPNVYLYNLDDLAEIAEENMAQRKAEVAGCRAILAERTVALWHQVAPYLHAQVPFAGTDGSAAGTKDPRPAAPPSAAAHPPAPPP